LKDGVNVDKHASDYILFTQEISKGETLSIPMAAGGGYTAILSPIE